ncbi:MAG: FAD-binding oxidoreductase, partial [Desulfobacteraceae bacterium]|nr:FAD-binding oxidoreductase [Desulfobacteraceae bacterium]
MSKTLVSQEIIDEFSAAIGKEKVSIDKPTRTCYSITHGPEFLLHENYFDYFLPDAVLGPSCTEDVQNIVRIANKYEIPLVPSGGRSGSCGAEGMRGGIVVDMCRMAKILELDEKNYRITGEAGVRMIDLVSYLKKRGYMAIDWPDSDEIATLGSRAAINGYNWWENRWGSAGSIIQGIEVVLPDGNVVQLGRGSNIPTKSSVGWNLMDLFIGSRGTLGIVTKVTEKFTDFPPRSVLGRAAFHTFKEGIEAYLDLKKGKYSNTVWRVTCNVNQRMDFPIIAGKSWPDEIAMMVNYELYGESSEVEGMGKRAGEILKNHNGFTKPEMSEMMSWFSSHASEWKGISGKVTNIALGFASHLFGGQIKTEGYSARPVFLDPNIPDSSLSAYYSELQKLLATIEDGETYPNLAECAKVYDHGAIIPGVIGFNKMWIVIH